MGLRKWRQEFTPIPFSRKDKRGKHVPPEQVVEKAAEYLENTHWGREQFPAEDWNAYQIVHQY
eukprot:12925699-Prorocentrum_lima.AAC.1